VKTKHDIFRVLAGLLFTVLVSCSGGEDYSCFHHIKNGKWCRDSLLVFTIDSLIHSPGAIYDVTVELTINRGYPYRDLWLQIDQNLTDSHVRTDTLRYLLADEYGKWLGSGAGGLNHFSLPCRSFMPRDSVYNYRLTVRHAMDDDLLQGVEKVGIKIAEADADNYR
jgi:gliding motility-associated lipoprotein GldH